MNAPLLDAPKFETGRSDPRLAESLKEFPPRYSASAYTEHELKRYSNIQARKIADDFEATRIIRANHPSLPGHFPGAPLVPGVVILDEVLAALIEWHQDSHLTGIRMVKFLAPLQPEQAFTISLSVRNEHAAEVNFCCRAEDRVIVEGQLEVAWGAQ